MEQPMIYTSMGNVPVSDLEYQTEWDVQETHIKFTERYLLGDEVVRQSAHVYSRLGMAGEATTGNLGG